MKNSTKLKAGLLLTSLACAAGATAALVLLQKKREEEVYHEAELKAMDELEKAGPGGEVTLTLDVIKPQYTKESLEEMMRSESDCASCACAEECPAPETYAAAKNDAAAAETPAEPPEEESDGKPDIEIEIVDGDEETDEDDDEPETAGLED